MRGSRYVAPPGPIKADGGSFRNAAAMTQAG